MIFDLIGWSSTLLVIFGRFLIAGKKRSGFVVVIIGGVGVGIQAYMIDNWSIVFLAVILAIADGFGWVYWGRHG